MILLLLQRLHVKLDRDVIFLAEAGEEGTTSVGIDFMVKQHWPEIEAEYALAEGGSIVEDGRQGASRADQTPRRRRRAACAWWRTARPGTARVPAGKRGGAPGRGRGARRDWQTPMRLNETTRAYFERLAAITPPAEAARYRGILDPARAAESRPLFPGARARPLFHAAHFRGADHFEGRLPRQRDSVRSRSLSGRARAARRRHDEVPGANCAA